MSEKHPRPTVLSLEDIDAAVFDLDGVVTDTASLHERAWSDAFREVLTVLTPRGREFVHDDYKRLVDGRPRLDGVRAVLSDRHIELPDGSPADAPGATSAWAIANAKDRRFTELLKELGPRPFPSSVSLIEGLRSAGILIGLVTASRHSHDVLDPGDLGALFDAVVDGQATAAMGLRGKPAPDTLAEAMARLGVSPGRTAFFDDASAGVAAGRAAGAGFVIGVDREANGVDVLESAGAHAVVADLSEVVPRGQGPAHDAWHLGESEEDLGREGVRETLFTLGNGYMATRGSRPYVVADATTFYPGTYFGGLYDRAQSQVGDRTFDREVIVNAPNWLPLDFAVGDGPSMRDPATQVISKGIQMDLRTGVLVRRFSVVTGDKVTEVMERRVVSMADPHLAAIELTIVAANWSGVLELWSGIDGAVTDKETIEERLLASQHLEVTGTGESQPDAVWLAARTLQSHVTIATATRTTASQKVVSRSTIAGPNDIAQKLTFKLERAARVTIEKIAALYTSRDFAISEPVEAARNAANRAASFASVVEEHERAWAEVWQRARIELGSDLVERQRVLNLHGFHLLQVASRHVADHDAGLGARGLHGEGYLGHVFWDEVFVLPRLTLHFPESARALLSYRSRRLAAARFAALSAGFGGAKFPWQSGSDGRDETPHILYNPLSGHWITDDSRFQQHVGLAVAFNFWQYWQASGDLEHLVDHGAEVMLEIARFFAGRCEFDPTVGKQRIKGLMGPDEFHDGYPDVEQPGIDDNAYTNVFAAWLFTRVGELAGQLERSGRAATLERLRFGEEDLRRFDELSHTLYVPFFDGMISQFEGYEKLLPIDLDAYRDRYGNIGRLDLILEAEGDTVRRYQVSKQPDVLMLLYLFSTDELREILGRLGYSLGAQAVRRTVDFYSKRVTHGSSLSRVVHAWVLARSDREASWSHFTEALDLDLHDSQGGTTREGIHVAGMAGTIDIVSRCYLGLEVRADSIWLHPSLPRELKSLALTVQFRDHVLELEVNRRRLHVTASGGPDTPVVLFVRGQRYDLAPGASLEHELR